MTTAVSTIVNALNVFTRKQLGKVQLGMPQAVGFNTFAKKVMPEGEGYRVPIFQSGGHVSHTFSTSQTYGADPTQNRFFLESANLVDFFRVLQITNKALKAMEANTQRHILDLLGNAKDSVEQTVLEIEREIWGNGYATLGTCSAVGADNCTLTNAADAKYFKPGMGIVASEGTSGAEGDALIDSGAVAVVSSSNPFTGVVTFTAALSTTITTLAADDFLYPAGSAANGGARVGMHGMGWWAETPVASEDFIGIDRSTAPHVFAMQTSTGSASDLQGAIIDADAAAFDINGTTRDHVFMNPRDYATLADTAHTQTRNNPGSRVRISHNDVVVEGTSGTLTCRRSPFIAQNTIYILNVPSWELVHLPKLPVNIDNFDNQMAMKLASSAGQEIRVESYVDLVSTSPASNVELTVS